MGFDDSTTVTAHPTGTRPRPVRRAALALLAGVALVAVAGCAPTDPIGSGSSSSAPDVAPDEGPPQDGGVLRVGVSNESTGWNPNRNAGGSNQATVASSVLEPLVWFDANAQQQPWLAESVTPNATNDRWTIRLRSGIRFHDGEPLDAAVLKQNLDDLRTAPLTALAYGTMLGSFTVVDDLTVEAQLTQPWGAFAANLLTRGIMASAMMDAPDQGSSHPIGTGPFVFESWERDDTFRARRNPSYWRPGEPHLDAVEFKVLTDPAAQSQALLVGDIDMIFTASAEHADALPEGYRSVREWTSQPQMIIANTRAEVDGQPNPAADVHLRRALARATDQEQIADAAGEGIGSPTSPFSATGPWGYPDDENGYLTFDLDEATREREAYQAATGSGPPTLTVTYARNDRMDRVLQVLQQQWQQAGITLQLEGIEATSFQTLMVGGDFQLAAVALYGSSDPDSNFLFWSSTTVKGPGQLNLNLAEYQSATVDENLALGRESSDHEARKAAYHSIVREHNEQALHVWLYWTPFTTVAAPQVHGLDVIEAHPFATGDTKNWFGRFWLTR